MCLEMTETLRATHIAIGARVALETVTREGIEQRSKFPQEGVGQTSQAVRRASTAFLMATQNQRYTLVGFSDELDWRAITFVEPVPSNRMCKACGLVPRVTAFLPCLHVVCKECYEQCRHDDGHRCPLDGQQVQEDDIEWIEFPVQNLLKRKVKCWNEERGCDVVLSASDLNEHFCHDCGFHCTSCPECSMNILRSSVCGHLQSKCRDCVGCLQSVNPQTTNCNEKPMMMALKACIDVQVGEMKEKLDHVLSSNNVQSDHLNEISHNLNSIKEALQQISSRTQTLENVASQTPARLHSSEAIQETLTDHGVKLGQLAQSMISSHKTLKEALQDTKLTVEHLKGNTAVNALRVELRERFIADSDMFKEVCENISTLKQNFEKVLEDSRRPLCGKYAKCVAGIGESMKGRDESGSSSKNKQQELALNTLNGKRYEFFLNKFKAMKESTHSKGSYNYMCEKIYISGYHVSPGVYCITKDEHVLLYPTIQLHKGVIDEFLEWPFNQNICFTVKHPSESKQWQKVGDTSGDLQFYGRPEESSNKAGYFDGCLFALDDLERDGYISDDKLQIVWEMVSKDITK